ncbi:MAG: ribulose-phosphate 3-epimerase [Nitrospirota bacterium]
MKIVPAILAEKFDDFLLRLKQAESFVDYVQIDLMDGLFVPTKSFPLEELNGINTPLSFEAHLMVMDPSEFINRINNQGLKKVIFHFESEVKHLELVNSIKERELSAGIAIKPETEVKEFREIAGYVDTLLFMTVDPCCYGRPFIPEVLDKISEARHIFRDKAIAADGGVSLENLKRFLEIGVDYVCVGSRIFLEGDPEENYRRFIEKLKELEGSFTVKDDSKE